MADLESGKNVQGQQDNPSSVVVQEQEGASTSNDVEAALLERLLPKLKDEIQKGLQSTKDKRIGKLEGEVTKLQEMLVGVDRYEEYRQKGLSSEDAKRQMQIDDLLSQKGQPAPEPERTGSAMDWATIQKQLLENGLSDDLAGENLQDFVQKLTAKLKPASQAAIVQPAGGSPGEPDLRKAYEAELSKIPRGNVQKIVELKLAYKKKGLNVN